MAFLDNSGDIILGAVLTDTGRMRLARGDGSFRIAKFALGDDEIDYGLFDKLNVNGSSQIISWLIMMVLMNKNRNYVINTALNLYCLSVFLKMDYSPNQVQKLNVS